VTGGDFISALVENKNRTSKLKSTSFFIVLCSAKF
jgi:hypothetical protein